MIFTSVRVFQTADLDASGLSQVKNPSDVPPARPVDTTAMLRRASIACDSRVSHGGLNPRLAFDLAPTGATVSGRRGALAYTLTDEAVMRLLITGGTGFIGSRRRAGARELGHEVRVTGLQQHPGRAANPRSWPQRASRWLLAPTRRAGGFAARPLRRGRGAASRRRPARDERARRPVSARSTSEGTEALLRPPAGGGSAASSTAARSASMATRRHHRRDDADRHPTTSTASPSSRARTSS